MRNPLAVQGQLAMMNQPLKYHDHPRPDVRALLEPKGPILDVGCGTGALCSELSRSGVEVIGIEPAVKAAKIASKRYSDVHIGPFEDFSPGDRRFSQIVFADVLEHMVDPWNALSRAARWLTDDGRVVLSIPNVRNWRVVFNLLVRGRWAYTDEGLLDRTHLRFFTRRESLQLAADAGLVATHIRPSFEHPILGAMSALSIGMADGFLALQWLIVACARD